jgi:hypothetical protein
MSEDRGQIGNAGLGAAAGAPALEQRLLVVAAGLAARPRD